MIIGSNYNGFGNDSHCELLLNGEETYTNPYTMISDSSRNSITLNVTGETSPQMVSGPSCSVSDFGKSVWHFNHTGSKSSYLETNVTITDILDLWNHNHCIDFWIYLEDIASGSGTRATYIFDVRQDFDNRISCAYQQVNGTFTFGYIIKVKGSIVVSLLYDKINTDEWYHISLNRLSNSYKMFVNGLLVTSGTSSAIITLDSGTDLIVGDKYSTIFNNLDTYINGFRLSKGDCRWKNDFISPNRQY